MVKVVNIVVNEDTITMDCLRNGNANECFHVILNKEFEPFPGTVQNPYVCRAIAMVRRYRKKTGQIPSELVSVWH